MATVRSGSARESVSWRSQVSVPAAPQSLLSDPLVPPSGAGRYQGSRAGTSSWLTCTFVPFASPSTCLLVCSLPSNSHKSLNGSHSDTRPLCSISTPISSSEAKSHSTPFPIRMNRCNHTPSFFCAHLHWSTLERAKSRDQTTGRIEALNTGDDIASEPTKASICQHWANAHPQDGGM